jgi:general secretion pathway protein I
MRNNDGFTLFEVIVAVAILSISLVMVMQLFSAGLRSARSSCDYTRAVIHAKDKMAELADAPEIDSGDFEDGFKWETDVQDYKQNEDASMNLKKLIVRVYWPDVMEKQKTFELVSLKMIQGE